MTSKYDSRTTIFTPDGRLLQVEYALNNINNAGLCIGLVTKKGIVLSCEKESTSKLLEKKKNSDKIYKIDTNIACSVGGLASDANILIDNVREYSQNYYMKYRNYTPVENLVRYISDLNQVKTIKGSNRPYGAGFLFGGWDRIYGYQLYNADPSGIYNCWKAHAIGQGSQNAESFLKQNYNEEMNLEEGIKMSIRVLRKSLDKNVLSSENIEVFVLEEENGEISQNFIGNEYISRLLEEIKKIEEDEKANEEKNKN